MKKLVALFLIMMLVLSAGTMASAEKKYGFDGYDPGITLTMIKGIRSEVVNIMDLTTPISGETFEDNRYLDLWKDELGISIEYEWIAVDDEAKQKRALQIATGELPDIIWVDKSSAMLTDLAENDMIWDMTEIYEEHASDLLKSLVSYNGSTAALDSVSVGGKLFAIPNVYPSFDQCQYMWIRQDWLDNLGLEAPTNYEELLKVAEAFTTQDPDGNGENDTWGLHSSMSMTAGDVVGFNWGCHAYPGKWIEKEDGTLAYGSVQPEVLTALKYMREAIASGYVHPEFGTGGSFNAAVNGKVGIVFCVASMPVGWNGFYSNVPEDVHWTAYPLISVDDKPAINMLDVELYIDANALAVSKSCEHPEALVKMFNVFVEAMWGENNNYAYYYAGDAPTGNEYNISDVQHLANDFNIQAYKQIWEAVENGTTDQLSGSALVYYTNMFESHRGWIDYISNEWSGNRILAEIYDPQNLYMFNAYVGAPTETQVERSVMLSDLENKMVSDILLGEVEPEEGFAAFVEQWNELGGADITAEINAAMGK